MKKITDEELIHELLLLLTIRVADDQGQIDLTADECSVWHDKCKALILMCATRFGGTVHTVQ